MGVSSATPFAAATFQHSFIILLMLRMQLFVIKTACPFVAIAFPFCTCECSFFLSFYCIWTGYWFFLQLFVFSSFPLFAVIEFGGCILLYSCYIASHLSRFDSPGICHPQNVCCSCLWVEFFVFIHLFWSLFCYVIMLQLIDFVDTCFQFDLICLFIYFCQFQWCWTFGVDERAYSCCIYNTMGASLIAFSFLFFFCLFKTLSFIFLEFLGATS